MPYLDPSRVLARFSSFAREEIRPEIDDEFTRGQIGSMSSTMRFLANELSGQRAALTRQREALLDALDELEETLDRTELEPIVDTVSSARTRVKDVDEGTDELESALLSASNDVLAEIDRNLEGETARRARRPLYDFLDVRVQSQLEMLGRDR